MQLALNAVIFILGYSIAFAVVAKPTQSRKAIAHFLSKLRVVTNGFKSAYPVSEAEKTDLLPEGENQADRAAVLSSKAELLTKAEVEERYDENTWQGLAYQDFKNTILAKGAGLKTFPCVYATMGYRANDHRYVFLESDDPSEPRNVRKVAPALLEYLRISTTLGPNTSLVIVGGPPEKRRSVEEHNQTFWDMLRGLRIWDPKPWPEEIPQDTEDAKWTFCFNGEPVFPVMLTPAHQERWSRHMSVPIVALQPKWVLDNLLGTAEKRQSAQNKVRSLLQKYDTIGVSPDLTSYGDFGTSEVRQLCLQDKNETVECPYRNFDG